MSSSTRAARRPRPSPGPAARRWARRPEAWLLVAFAAFAFAPFVVLAGGGDVFNGSDGLQTADHMQYMGFIRDAGEHLLFSNRFDVVHDPHLFLHPMFALSGLLWRLGASVQLAFLVWKPITVAALFIGYAAYVRRLLGRHTPAATAALALALFYLAPATSLSDWLGASPRIQFGTGIAGLEMHTASYSIGGYPGALSIAMMPLFLLGIERVLDPSKRSPGRSARRYSLLASAAGLLCSWLHPWQGLTLLLIVAGLAVWERLDRRLLALAPAVLLTAAPLAYMWVLSKTDSSWATVSQPNDLVHFADWLALGLAPLVLAIPGYRGRNLDVQERLLRLWPIAALVLYVALDRSWFYHAFAGLSLPMAILVVKGLRPLRLHHALVTAAIALVTVPGAVWYLQVLHQQRSLHFFTSGERAALSFLDRDGRRGAVLAPRQPLGQAVPAFTGRNTWVGHYNWTPDNDARTARAEALFSGAVSPAEARGLVRESRAAFLAADCGHRTDLRPLLGPVVGAVHRFGCATVYDVRQAQTRPPSGPGSNGPSR